MTAKDAVIGMGGSATRPFLQGSRVWSACSRVLKTQRVVDARHGPRVLLCQESLAPGLAPSSLFSLFRDTPSAPGSGTLLGGLGVRRSTSIQQTMWRGNVGQGLV